jgi:hypothetical protein
VSGGYSVGVLVQRFGDAVDERMLQGGWSIVEERDGRFVSPEFSREFSLAVRDGFQARAVFFESSQEEWFPEGESGLEPGVVVVSASVGVVWPAAEALLGVLGARMPRSGIYASLYEILDESEDGWYALGTEQHADAAAEFLTGAVLRVAPAFASERASAQAFLLHFRSWPDFMEMQPENLPVMLALDGQSQAARSALAELAGHHEDKGLGRLDYERFSYQLNRYLDGEFTLEDLPAGAAAPVAAEPEPPRSVASREEDRRKRRAAMDAVRASNPATREARAELLARELARQGLHDPPVVIEGLLDALDPGHKPSAVQASEQAAALARDIVGNVRAVLAGKVDEDPSWMRPPPPAFFAIPEFGSDWVAVSLSGDSTAWLQRVHAQAPRRFGDSVLIEAWLHWQEGPPPRQPRIGVAIGAETVGVLEHAATQLAAPSLAQAATRGELPRTAGRLTRRAHQPTYLLEIRVQTATA